MPASATRLVSLHDPDARAIAKGRLGKPVEFGYKGQVVDNVDGIVLDHSVHLGNPPDAPLLAPAIGRIQTLFDRVVRAVTADRGYGEAKIEQELRDLGVKTVVIPRKGKPGQPPAASSSTGAGSGGWSSGAPDPRAASPTSSAATAGTAPCSTPWPARRPGAGSACSPTTVSRSPT